MEEGGQWKTQALSETEWVALEMLQHNLLDVHGLQGGEGGDAINEDGGEVRLDEIQAQ